VLTSQENWDKTRRLVQETASSLKADPHKLPRKRLEEIRGFLMYVTRMYPGLTPYMIGYHLTIDLWRQHRDKEGWNLMGRARRVNDELIELEGCLHEDESGEGSDLVLNHTHKAPRTVSAVPWFFLGYRSSTLFDRI
jgi:hypothetical protein